MGKVTSNLSTTTKQVTGVCNVIIYFINQSLDVTSCTLVNHMVWPPKYFSCYIVEMSGVHIGQLVLVLCGCGSLRKMLDSWGKQVCVCVRLWYCSRSEWEQWGRQRTEGAETKRFAFTETKRKCWFILW